MGVILIADLYCVFLSLKDNGGAPRMLKFSAKEYGETVKIYPYWIAGLVTQSR